MIEEIERLVQFSDGDRYAIIVCSNASQMHYWEKRLTAHHVQESLLPRKLRIAVVCEDWERGAGNGLGTLNAFKLGYNLFKQRDRCDLFDALKSGASCTIYHTAGRGMRLYPLTASEGGDKSRILLPSTLRPDSSDCMTLLELVIRQTQPLSRPGRISTFWGDQLFIPSNPPPKSDPDLPIELLVCKCPPPQASQWKSCGFENYGIVEYRDEANAISMVDKLSEKRYTELIERGLFKKGLGLNLGAFSLSPAAMRLLLEEFDQELKEQDAHYDSDPDFWAPLTLEWELYSLLKGRDNESHYRRMRRLRQRWENQYGTRFGPSAYDVGCESNWWDFGSVRLFHVNLLKLLKTSEESLLRRLLAIKENKNWNECSAEVQSDDRSLIIGSKIKRGKIHNSIVIGVEADELFADNSVIIRCRSPKLRIENGVVYRAVSNDPLNLPKNGVRVDCRLDEERIPILTSLERDGKADWEFHRPNERYSYRELAEKMATLVEV